MMATRDTETTKEAANQRFEGQVAIVTGGSRGIGHAITNTLVQEGVSVATCARGKSALDEALAQ